MSQLSLSFTIIWAYCSLRLMKCRAVTKGRGPGNSPGYYECESRLLRNHWKVKKTSFCPPASCLLSLPTWKINDNPKVSSILSIKVSQVVFIQTPSPVIQSGHTLTLGWKHIYFLMVVFFFQLDNANWKRYIENLSKPALVIPDKSFTHPAIHPSSWRSTLQSIRVGFTWHLKSP